MWVPASWADVLELLGQLESDGLDFKRDLPQSGKGAEFAKDVAAMTRLGGLLVYGLEEDPATGEATRIAKVPVAGALEQLQSILNSNVQPVPEIRIHVIKESVGDTEAVIVVEVPASQTAPHMVQFRYPMRRGTVTAWMSESEVAAAYALRLGDPQRPPSPGDLLGLFASHPSIWSGGDQGSSANGLGLIRVVVKPDDEIIHPAAPELWSSLTGAVNRASAVLRESVAPPYESLLFELLDDWKPAGTKAWVNGYLGEAQSLLRREAAAVVLTRPDTFSFMVSLPLFISEPGRGTAYKCAWENKVAVAVMSCVAIAGEWYRSSGVPDGSAVKVGLSLSGWDQAVSFAGTHGRPTISTQGMTPAADRTEELLLATVEALSDASAAVARDLLGPWLATMQLGRDTFATVR